MEKFRDEIKNIEEKIAELEKLKREAIDAMRKACTHDKIRIYHDSYDGTTVYCKKCGASQQAKNSTLYRIYKNNKLEKNGKIVNGNCRHLKRVEIVNDIGSKCLNCNIVKSSDKKQYKCTECDLVESDTEESVLKFLYKIDENNDL